MAAKYKVVLLEEVEQLLRSAKGWVRTVKGNTKEYVFSYKLRSNPRVEILVYTSITRSHRSRGKGRDAIRVCAVMGNRGLVKSSRVHRVENWRANLKKRIITVIGQARERSTWACFQ